MVEPLSTRCQHWWLRFLLARLPRSVYIARADIGGTIHGRDCEIGAAVMPLASGPVHSSRRRRCGGPLLGKLAVDESRRIGAHAAHAHLPARAVRGRKAAGVASEIGCAQETTAACHLLQSASAGNWHTGRVVVVTQLCPVGQSAAVWQASWHLPMVHTKEPVQSL